MRHLDTYHTVADEVEFVPVSDEGSCSGKGQISPDIKLAIVMFCVTLDGFSILCELVAIATMATLRLIRIV